MFKPRPKGYKQIDRRPLKERMRPGRYATLKSVYAAMSTGNPWRRRVAIILHATGLRVTELARIGGVHRVSMERYIMPGAGQIAMRRYVNPVPSRRMIHAITKLEAVFAEEITRFHQIKLSRIIHGRIKLTDGRYADVDGAVVRQAHQGPLHAFSPEARAAHYQKVREGLRRYHDDPFRRAQTRLKRIRKRSPNARLEVVESWSRFENDKAYIPGRSLAFRKGTKGFD